MDEQDRQLKKMLRQALAETGRTSKMHELLGKIVEETDKAPLLLWNSEEIDSLAQAALRVLLFDIIEDEEKEIAWVHRTFAYITQALLRAREEERKEEDLFEILKNRVILLHSHDDFFMETLDYFFFHNTKVQNVDVQEKRSYLLKRVAAMQAKDLLTLDEYKENLGNDSYLQEIEQKLLDKYTFSEQELVEAQLLLDTLYKYIWYKYKHADD